jgi:hypothetical protein
VTRHRFDPFSFIAGAVAVGVAATVLLGQVSISLVDLRIGGPVLVLALGLALLLGGGRERRDTAADGATAPGGDEIARTDDAGGPSEPDQDAR